MGVRVPDDLSVIGIDDHDFAEAMGLTTVRQRPDEQAELGTKMLLDELDGTAGRCAPRLPRTSSLSGARPRRGTGAAPEAPRDLGGAAPGRGSGSAGQLADRDPAGRQPAVRGGGPGHIAFGQALDAQPHIHGGVIRVDLVRHCAIVEFRRGAPGGRAPAIR